MAFAMDYVMFETLLTRFPENSAFANFCQNPINVHLKMIAVIDFAVFSFFLVRSRSLRSY
jgi:hypothetical protein